eukprot:s36_g6.t1
MCLRNAWSGNSVRPTSMMFAVDFHRLFEAQFIIRDIQVPHSTTNSTPSTSRLAALAELVFCKAQNPNCAGNTFSLCTGELPDEFSANLASTSRGVRDELAPPADPEEIIGLPAMPLTKSDAEIEAFYLGL